MAGDDRDSAADPTRDPPGRDRIVTDPAADGLAAALFDHAGTAMALVGPDLCCRRLNDRLADRLGAPNAVYERGRALREVLPELAAAEASLREVLSSGVAAQVVLPSGASAALSPVRAAGKVRAVVVALSDAEDADSPAVDRPGPSAELERLLDLTDAMLGHASLRTLVDEFLPRLCDLLRVDAAQVLLLEGNGLVSSGGVGVEAMEAKAETRFNEGVAGIVAADRKPFVVAES